MSISPSATAEMMDFSPEGSGEAFSLRALLDRLGGDEAVRESVGAVESRLDNLRTRAFEALRAQGIDVAQLSGRAKETLLRELLQEQMPTPTVDTRFDAFMEHDPDTVRARAEVEREFQNESSSIFESIRGLGQHVLDAITYVGSSAWEFVKENPLKVSLMIAMMLLGFYGDEILTLLSEGGYFAASSAGAAVDAGSAGAAVTQGLVTGEASRTATIEGLSAMELLLRGGGAAAIPGS